jgi:hypothetical protein
VKPRMLDLFCCAGGAGMGYHRAGFEVVGVDINPQPNYPFEFHRADALTFPLDGFDAIHASPGCQRKARVTAWRGRREDHPDTLTPTLARLRGQSVPWIVENVPEAADQLRPDYLLCGTQFGLNVRRHRIFEVGNWAHFALMPPCRCYRNRALLPFMHKGERAFADAMGCTWMSNVEARQALPPAYTQYIGEALLASLAVPA